MDPRSIKGKVHGVSDWDINEPARAHVNTHGVLITLDDGRNVDLPWSGIKLGQNYLYDHQATLEGVDANGRTIRFTAEGPELGQQLAQYAPGGIGPKADRVVSVTGQARRKHRTYLGIAVAILALLLSSFNWLPYVVANHFPVEWEEELGKSGLSSVDAKGDATDPIVVDGVQRVWQRVQTGLQPNPYHFQLHVIDSPVVNAFAMPGGTVVVYTGLLGQVESPEELAGVLGHESQHVIQRHSLKALVRTAEMDIVLAMLFNNMGEELQKLGGKMDGLAYSRSNETEADSEGAQVLMRAHIDPSKFPDFFRRMQQKNHTHHLAIMQTHPSDETRIEHIQMLIRMAPPQTYQPIDIDWQKFEDAVHKLPGGSVTDP